MSVSSAPSVGSDSTNNSLRALLKLFMCKCCATDCWNVTDGTQNAKDGPSGTQRRCLLFHICENCNLSHQLQSCTSIYLPFTNVSKCCLSRVCSAVTSLVLAHHIKTLDTEVQVLVWIISGCWIIVLSLSQKKKRRFIYLVKIKLSRGYFSAPLVNIDHSEGPPCT